MSVPLRSRHQSQPSSGDDDTPSKPQFRRLKSVTIEPTSRAARPPLLRAKTTLSDDKPTLTNRMSVNVVEDLLECKLCKKRLSQPKMLLCQHTFCLACLQVTVTHTDKGIQCHNCGQLTELKTPGPDGISELPPNLYLDSLLNALQQEAAEKPGQDSRCVRCQTVGASLCHHCRQAFCTVCWSSHISDLKSQLPRLLDQLRVAEDSLKHRSEDFRDVCHKLKEHIDVAVELKIQSLRVEQDRLNQKAHEVLQQGEQSFQGLLTRIQYAEDTVSSSTDFGTVSDNKRKVDKFLQLHRMTSELLQEVSRWGEARPTFNQDSFQIDMGEVTNMGSESEDIDDVFYDDNARNGGPVTSPDALSQFYRTHTFTPRFSLDHTVMQRPAGVGVAPWGDSNHMYVAGTDSRQVLVIDRSRMKIVNQLTAPSMMYPHSIAFSKPLHEVYVTDKWNHCVHVFSAEGVYLRQLGKKGHAEGQFQSPEGIATRSGDEDNFIYVCDTGNDRVQVLDPQDGNVIRVIGILDPLPGHKYMRTEFNQPTGITVFQDKVVVADLGNRRIKTYSLQGEKLNEFGSTGEARGQFRAPECIAIDHLGFILVGDSGNARIQVFKPNYTFVKSFGGRGSSPGKFSGISGIAVTSDLDIIVTDSKNGSIQIF